MRKKYSLLSVLVLVSAIVVAGVQQLAMFAMQKRIAATNATTYSITFNGQNEEFLNGAASTGGYFSFGEKHNFNNKFSCTYNGVSYSKGLKMEGTTQVAFTTSSTVSSVTIVQSTWSDFTIKFDDAELNVESAEKDANAGYRVYTISDVKAGAHAITRGDGESGIFRVDVTEYVSEEAGETGDTIEIIEKPVIVKTKSLQDVPFCTYNGFTAEAQIIGTANCEWVVGEASGTPYGDPSVINFADVSSYSKLIITVVEGTEGSPRILMNRDENNGQWNEDETQSHLIDNTKEGWSSKYFSQEGNAYTVDIKQLVADKGFAHLHAVKGANFGNVTIESMILEYELDSSSYSEIDSIPGVTRRSAPMPRSSGFVVSNSISTYYYLYNVEAGRFFTEGNSWGTQASLGKEGLKVAFTLAYNESDVYLFNDYSLKKNAWKQVFFDSETVMFVDRSSQSNYGWGVKKNGDTFRLYASNSSTYNPILNAETYPNKYMGLDASSATTALSPFLAEGTGHYIDWVLVAEDEYNNFVQNDYNAYLKSEDLYDVLKQAYVIGIDITSFVGVYENVQSTAEELQTAIEGLRNKIAKSRNNFLVNPSFENKTYGWSYNSGINLGYGVAEVFEQPFDIYQEFEGLPNGYYEVRVKAFCRPRNAEDAWSYRNTDNVTTCLYANNDSVCVANLMSEAQNSAAIFYSGHYYVLENTYYVADDMETASLAFAAGLYENVLSTKVTNGKLRIGIRALTGVGTSYWTCFDDFRVRYVGEEGMGIYLTDKLVNPNYTEGEQGWTVKAAQGGSVVGGGSLSNPCYQAFNNKDFDVYQTIESAEEGLYEVTFQGFSRYGVGSDAYNAYNNGNVFIPVYAYVNNSLSTLPNVYSEPVTNSSFYTADDNGSYYSYSNWHTYYYYPNSMQTASTAFSAGMYQNSMYGIVKNSGDALRIGVKGNSTVPANSWAAWDNFKVVYWGKSIARISMAIDNAAIFCNNLIESNKDITWAGKNKLRQAVNEAKTISSSSDDADAMLDALNNLYETVRSVMIKNVYDGSEVITFDSSVSGADIETVAGKKSFVTFSKGTSTNNGPMNYSGIVRLYANNDVTISSEEIIGRVEFTTEYSYDLSASASTGTYADGVWEGSANSVTIKNVNNTQSRINQIEIFYEAPLSDSLYYARLQTQVNVADAAMAALVYPNVPGKTELVELTDSARSVLQKSGVDRVDLVSLAKDISLSVNGVKAIHEKYVALASAITNMQGIANKNQHVEADILSEALAFAEVVQKGLTEGAYSSADITELQNRIANYCELLQVVYLVIHVDEAGTLGDLVLSEVENFSDVNGLRVSGYLNTTDMTNIKSRMTNVAYLDLKETDLTYIAKEQFQNQTKLKSIVLPKNLKNINDNAFYGCTNMQEIDVPSTLVTIGSYAFYGCRNLQEIDFPSTLVSIGDYAFYNCGLKSIVVPEGVTSIGNYAFSCSSNYNNNGNYITYLYAKLFSVSLPSTLQTLGQYAFYYQKYLNTVTIADGLTSISSSSFADCSALSKLRLPATLQTIGSSAFENCASLSSLELPEGLTTLNNYSFSGCSNLKKVVLPSTLNSVSYPFVGCTQLTQMTLKAIIPPTVSNGIMNGSESQCTLTVPNLSATTYKQTSYWDQFNIVGADILPENITITKAYRLNWPENQDLEYKPNVTLTNNSSSYGALTVSSRGTLSAGIFSQFYDFYYQYTNYSRAINFTSLINQGTVRADQNVICLDLYAGRWNFVCLPFDVKVSEIVDDGNGAYVIRRYDGRKRANSDMANTWVTMTKDSTLRAGEGYIWHAATYTSGGSTKYLRRFIISALQTVNKNNMFRNENVEIGLLEYLAEFPQNRSWNLVGNPYPCYFDTRAIQTTAPITVWNLRNNSYSAYSPMDDSYVLTPGEAFFIQRPVEQGSITLLKEGRQTSKTVRDISYLNNARQLGIQQQRSVFNLVLMTNGQETDRTRFVINNGAEMGYNTNEDASKFFAEQSIGAELYTLNDEVRYAINERPLSTGSVQLGLRIDNEGVYTIHLDTKVENEVWLIDRMMGTETLLTEGLDYTFSAEAGTMDNRFVVRLGAGKLTGIRNANVDANANQSLYNLKGQKVNSQIKKGLYINKGKKVVVK